MWINEYPHILESKRNFHEVIDRDEINRFIGKNFFSKQIYVKELPKSITAELELPQSKQFIYLALSQLPANELPKKLTIYGLVNNRYIEVDLKELSFYGKDGEYIIDTARVALSYRQEPRIYVSEDDFWAENFWISKYSIHPFMEKIPDFITTSFAEFKAKMQKYFPDCDFVVYNKGDYRKEIQAVEQMHKPVFIEDSHKGLCAAADTEFADYKAYLGPDFHHEMELLAQENIRSLLIIPVTYTNLMSEKTLLGYFRMTSDNKAISRDIIQRLSNFAALFAQQLKKANMQKVKLPQKIANISKTGARIVINNGELADLFASNPEELALDIKPNPLLRFNLFGKIVNMQPENSQGFQTGIYFVGGGKRLGMPEWQNYINNFI